MNHFTLFKQPLRHLDLPGNVLRMKANEVDFSVMDSELLKETIAGLFHIMYESDGGVGLAAPMVGVTLRIMVADLQDGKPFVLINPEVLEQSEEMEEGIEANLCLPEVIAKVKRPKWIKYRGYNHIGELVEDKAEGFLAFVILHEIEVMDGKMFLDNLPEEAITFVAPDVLANQSLDRLYEQYTGDQVIAEVPQTCSLVLNPITVSPTMLKLQETVLRKKAARVDIEDWEPSQLKQLVSDMIWIQHYHEGVGLAAPQIGLSIQMTVIDNREDPTYVLINPEIIEKSEDLELGREGCISLPFQYSDDVNRHTRIVVDALNVQGETFRLEAEGFLAVILQHEIDHLNGVLFPDHLDSLEKLEVLTPDNRTTQTVSQLYSSD